MSAKAFLSFPLLQNLLDGFNHTNAYRLIFPDELHQGQKGDVEHLLGILKDDKHFSKGQQQAVNSAVMRCPPFPGGLRLPSEGINTLFKHAQQQGALAKVMPAALLALPDHPLARALASVFCGEPDMPRVPTLAEMLAMDGCQVQLLRVAVRRS